MTRIVVIGGGIAGMSAASRLSAGADVTVLEAEDALGYHASGRSAALIEQNYGAPPVQALNQASFPYLHDHGYLTPRGLMIVAREDERSPFEADVKEMGLEEISPQDAVALVPVLNSEKVAYAAHHAEAYDIDTDRLLQDYARTTRQNGSNVETGAKVTHIEWCNNLWRVVTAAGSFEAEVLVNAAGAWADAVAQLAGVAPLGITPHRRSMARIAAPNGLEVSSWPMFFGVSESWYAKPDAGALLVSPADEDPVSPHDAWADDLTLAKGLALYEGMVTAPVTRMLSNWAGLRSFAPDRSLVLGPDPRQPAFVWCAGQGGYGIQTSPAAGRLVADLIFARAPDIAPDMVARLTPGRLM